MISGMDDIGAAQVPWTGQIVDIRSGQPLADMRVWGGFRGRTDYTTASITGNDGRFNVIYPNPLDLGVYGFYQLTSTYIPNGALYFENVQKTTYPSETLVRVVPRNAYIRGVVRDRVSGQVITNATVAIERGGGNVGQVLTDARGEYLFLVSAYSGSNAGNYEEGIPPEAQVPHETWQQVQPITNYIVKVQAPGFRSAGTDTLQVRIALLSSTTPDLHTWLAFAVAPNTTNLNAAISTSTVNPYPFQQWLAQYFTSEQLTNSTITGATGDPDIDGLSNQQEFEIGTHPTKADTDDDTLPDGWEFTYHLNPLVADSGLDPDGDGYSNRLEFLYSSDPQVSSSRPNLGVSIHRAVRVDFPTVPSVRYQLQAASAIGGPWTNTGNSFYGQGTNTAHYFDAEPEHQQFFRITISGD